MLASAAVKVAIWVEIAASSELLGTSRLARAPDAEVAPVPPLAIGSAPAPAVVPVSILVTSKPDVATLAASIGVVLKPDESCKLVDQYEI